MSTFSGVIEEIPGISVDNFNADNLMSSAFFLSHCHTDHMSGLGVKFFHLLEQRKLYLYCTPISKAILMSNPDYKWQGSRSDYIRTIDGVSPVIINYQLHDETQYLTVTCIPAGHCPGSVMFLFENPSTRILYTGDFRIDPENFMKFLPLHDKINDTLIPKVFDNIYLDTTFFMASLKTFPSRPQCLEDIFKVVENWLSKNSQNIVVLECSANYGPECIFLDLAEKLKMKIHVKTKVYDCYSLIPSLADCITNDAKNSRIHACRGKKNSPRCPDIDEKFILTVVPSVLRWQNYKILINNYEWDNKQQRFYICYSSHGSHNEITEFIKYFQPKKLYPCVCPRGKNFNILKKQLNDCLKNFNKHKINWEIDFTRNRSINKSKKRTLTLSDDDDAD